MAIRHMGLFEGIGGFSLAARWAGWTTPVMVEWSAYCQAVLRKNFPDATIFGDIHHFDGRPYAGSIDVVTGGFPCQPYSQAGKRKGNDDDRALWPEMLRVIREVAPTWVVGENVAGILTMDGGRVFAGILADLENAGYLPEVYLIPAIGVGAPHRRDRVWIVAHNSSIGRHGGPNNQREGQASGKRIGFDDSRTIANANNNSTARQRQYSGGVLPIAEPAGFNGGNWWPEHWHEVATRICRVDDGLPAGVDGIGSVPAKVTKKAAGKSHRLEGLGNAVIPHIPFQIFTAINEYHARAI